MTIRGSLTEHQQEVSKSAACTHVSASIVIRAVGALPVAVLSMLYNYSIQGVGGVII